MFKVKHKKGKGLIKTVYAVDDTSHGLWFLVYEDGEWGWINSVEYEPYNK